MSFAHTDISRINIHSDAKFWSPDDKPFTISEERLMDQNIKDKKKMDKKNYISYRDIITIYRNLRENYEYNLRYEEAGQFFIREMELKRRYKENEQSIEINNVIKRNFMPIGIYYNLCRYGESIRRPLGWLFLLIFISSLSWYIYVQYFDNELCTCNNVEDIVWYGINRTFLDIFQINNNNIWIDFIIRASSVLILGTLTVAIKRKFERRFRH